MANYTTNTSDKSRKEAMRLLLKGGVGKHLFYVGKIKAGIRRAIIGWVCWFGAAVTLLTSIFSNEIPFGEGLCGAIGCVLIIVFVNLRDYIKLRLGTFTDNVGQYLRG